MVNLRSQAYRRTDLTQLPFDLLCQKAQEIRIGDGRDYYRYLCTLFPGAARTLATDDEKASRGDEFVEKVFYLVNLLDTDQSKFYGFHALIRIAATVFLPKNGRAAARSQSAVANANYRVLDMLEKRLMAPKTGLLSSISYYDFATAYRRLWSAWPESCRYWTEDPKSKDFTCWHKQNGLLLDLIHKKAYSEIRAKIMLTVGTQLPPELTVKIFDLAMEVEEVPRHAIMLATEEVEIEVPQKVLKVYGGAAIRKITVMQLLWKFCACERHCIKSRGGY